MIIQVGQVYMDKVTNQKTIYPNKTRKYLLPCMKEYGEVFINKLNNVFKVAVGLGDFVVTKSKQKKYERHLFILLDSRISTQYFIKFLDWIREQPMYEDDYVYGDIQKSTHHMIILQFPPKYYNSFTTFQEGKYSEMFKDTKDFDFFKSNPQIKKIFIKDSNHKIEFTERLNKRFGTTLTPNEYDGELEFPPKDKTEIFNHHLK